ncbi:MAG: CPBP family intramembrane metalloprotease [Myxococcales bacterium]|nr:CPBP family intramembrane metalloprotease [Myxococcales bacterium]
MAGAPEKKRPRRGTLSQHFGGRQDPFTSAILVFPLFVTYQLGILSQGGRGQNGVDFVTRSLIELCERDLGNYLLTLGGLCLAYLAILVILRRRGTFSPRAFLPMLVEASFYAATMGTLILFVIQRFLDIVPRLAIASALAPLDVVVIAAGAGLHEELIFRLLGMGGIGWLLAGITGRRRAWLAALVISSLVFSLAHHVGPAAEAFTFDAFVYRTLAGVFFAIVYQLRGFAVAAWTHALYDVYVLSLG